MSFSVMLGDVDLTDKDTYLIQSNPGDWRGTNGRMQIEVIVRGSTQHVVDNNRRAIIEQLNNAEHAWRYGRESDRVELAVQLGTSETIYFDVRGGEVIPTEWHLTGKFGWVVVSMVCDSHNGVPIARLDADARSTSGTLTNGSATYLLSSVTGDYPARTRITLVDSSLSGVINRFRLSLRSAASAIVDDWDPWINIVNAGVVDQSDTSAFNDNYERITIDSASTYKFLGRATMPPGALNKGPFNLRFRMRDNATVIGQPTGLDSSLVNIHVRQTAIASGAGSSTSIAPVWANATETNSSLLAVIKASKSMEKLGITSIVDGTGVTTITLTENHGYSDGNLVLIEDVSGNVPDINGTWTISSAATNQFDIPIDTTTPGTGGSARNTFFEDITSVPSGYIKIGDGTTSEIEIENEPSRSWLPPPPNTVEQTRVWIYAKLAAASESSTKTFTFNNAVSNRSAVLVENGSPVSTGGLGIVEFTPGDSLLNAPGGSANSIYLGVAASKDQTWSPTLGFIEEEDGGGLIVASQFSQEAKQQPWVAIPNDYDFPVLHGLISFSGTSTIHNLAAGTYLARVQAISASGHRGRATSSETVVLPHDGGGFELTWTAPTTVEISHYRITVQDPDGNFWENDTADNSTSYVVSSIDDWNQVSELPSTLAGAYTASPAIVLVTVGTDDMTASTTTPLPNYEEVGIFTTERDLLGNWHLAPEEGLWARLPPQEEMQNGNQPDWAVEAFAISGGGPSATFDIDALNLTSDESGMTLWYPSMDLATARTWVVELRRDGSVVAWLEDGSGNFVGQIAVGGRGFQPSAGDNIISIVADQASGVSVIDNARFTIQATLWPVADWSV